MRKVAAAVISPVGVVVLGILLYSLFQWYDFYSPESRCRREARKNVFGAQYVSGSETGNRFAQKRINEIIEKETNECMERLREN